LARPLQVKKQKKKEGEGGKKQEAASSPGARNRELYPSGAFALRLRVRGIV
jgi:hypothetical protein